ncbi:MAG TPA: sel1 repeat family protein [Henriciella marina]|uniref:tetratricopeptide repeat protein n=1 Tax=Henriciella sp. TaxID=1968823 RepID=UPI0017BE39EE|nr:tetratricopeptide repeat protein [Henriciella sp.]HIG23270.1 sel1 repeat family protein [Henriciella sp.]HIK64768.1 sel1 repeat family protein [Henriciella marina]
MMPFIRHWKAVAAVVALHGVIVPTAMAMEPASLPDRGNPEWIAQCGQEGGYQACENLANQHLKGLDGVPVSRTYTGYYLLKACRYGNLEMCEYATGMVVGDDNKPVDEPAALSVFKEAMAVRCINGDPVTCIAGAITFNDEDHAAYDPDYVGNSYAIGCERGSPSACFAQGLWFSPFSPPKGVQVDAEKSLIGYRRACISEPGDDAYFDAEEVSFGCYMSYYFLRGGEGVPAEPEQAEHALYRSCEMGNANNCEFAASAFHHGVNSVEKNPVSARTMAQKGCELGNMGACAIEGQLAFTDENYAKSFAAYQQACDAEPSDANCPMAAVAAYRGFGAENAKTTEYARAACDTGDGWACYTYASNTFWLDGDRHNRHLYAKSCSLGFSQGCDFVEELDARAARNAEIDRRNEQMIADLQRPVQPIQRTPTLGEQIEALGNSFKDWKPSYCSNSSITSRDGLSTTRPECADY